MYVKSVTGLYYYTVKFCGKKMIFVISTISFSMRCRLRVENRRKKFSGSCGGPNGEKIELG
jgi:hypothetical protein